MKSKHRVQLDCSSDLPAKGSSLPGSVNNLERAKQQAQSSPKLEILPPAPRRLWDELRSTPKHFVLYIGTALALRLAHRSSEDFDSFSNHSFAPHLLRKAIPYLHDAEMSQFEENTLTAIVDRTRPVKISFFGGLALNRVQDPDVTPDNGIQVASLLDVAATKLATIQQRAQARDYEDTRGIHSPKIVHC